MKVTNNDELLSARAIKRGIPLTPTDARTLRLAQLTLRRWAERECGDSDDYAAWAIERDEQIGIPYLVTYPHTSTRVIRTRIPDREAGALARVATLCARLELYSYHQTDPRGCALWVSRDPLTDATYTDGLPCCV